MGRGPELDSFAAASADRECRGFVVGGSAGVGKSRLAEECLDRAAAAGCRVGRATASAAAGAVPLGAIAHLLPTGVDLSDPVAGFAAVVRGLTTGRPGPRRWVLLVDDMHLLDPASAVLLRQLMDTGMILLIGTVRSGEPYGKAVAALRGGDAVRRVDLTVLTPEQVEALLQAVLGGPVARRTLHELSAASGGNVLYLRELVLGALTAGDLTEDGEIWHLREGRLPGTARLTELIGTRLSTADSAGRPVLELLALCDPLPLADAEALAPPQVVAGLEQAGLIRVAQDRRRIVVSLAHPLYGEVLRAGLPVLRRRALLLDQAARFEARGARRRGDLLHIATWRLAATGTADPALLTQAAILARHVHDYPRTIALIEALPEEHRTTATRLMLGDAFFEMGRWDRAEATLAQADALAIGEQDKLAVALARTTNLLWSNAPLTEALAVNDAALDRITSPAGHRKLKINEGFMRIVGGWPAQGLALLQDLETEVGDASDVNAWLRGAWMTPFGLALVGRTVEAAAWAERAHAAHRQVDEHALASHPAVQRIPLVLALSEAGRPAEALREGERAYAELVAADSVVRVWMAVFLGRTEWLAGHPVTARRWWAEAAALARSIDHAMALRLVLGGLAACAAVLGDLDAAETTLAEHRTLPPSAPGLLSAGEERLGEAWLLAARGHLGQARSVLTAAARAARTTGHLTGEALLLTDVARLGGAKDAADRLTELAQRCDGAFAPARAQLATALTTDDPDQLLQVTDACQGIGANLLAAEAATAAAAAWRRTHHPRRASAAARRAAVALARCEGARTPLLTTAQTTAALTAREREIALLAAVGNASKDIARALTLSVRTVDNHLHHAYTKLGVTTRRELAQTLGTPAHGVERDHPHPPT
ncbi:LuxR C-terminal-related transcriptional regulator [Streptomyces sp. GESEQ-35]|uniref:helix-turn-helix transcriptional regulator n=1 Tax=Streptomyces sp. GESEQ-35 TaxID=2812657 RepID=UPI0027E2C088|nr:LuxR C-terminal-related transcriptional regulator [Streptomyces sp. GESEQ-35]